MITNECWGCGWAGKAPDSLAGCRVTCKRCGTESILPDSDTRVDFPAFRRDAIDPISEAKTDEVDMRGWPHLLN